VLLSIVARLLLVAAERSKYKEVTGTGSDDKNRL
jgi:hypothetical protein